MMNAREANDDTPVTCGCACPCTVKTLSTMATCTRCGQGNHWPPEKPRPLTQPEVDSLQPGDELVLASGKR